MSKVLSDVSDENSISDNSENVYKNTKSTERDGRKYINTDLANDQRSKVNLYNIAKYQYLTQDNYNTI